MVAVEGLAIEGEENQLSDNGPHNGPTMAPGGTLHREALRQEALHRETLQLILG